MAVMPPFWSKEEIEQLRAGHARFAEWAKVHRPPMTPQETLVAISGIYRMLPPETREWNPDPEKKGFRKLLDALALLRG
jgi:hypothetical protein